MPVRQIVKIDEERCDGCGVCVPSCHEGAIQIIDGKARVNDARLCDGLGDCLATCPQDAIAIEERNVPAFDERLVELRKQATGPAAGGCPGSAAMSLGHTTDQAEPTEGHASALRQWPVQLHLVAPTAPYFNQAPLLIAADCVPVAYGDFHAKLLKGRAMVMACPKLDDKSGYVDRLAQILHFNQTPEVLVALMEVPCCSGLLGLVQQAMQVAQSDASLRVMVLGRDGSVRADQQASAGGPQAASQAR